MNLSIGDVKLGVTPRLVGIITDENDISKLTRYEVDCADIFELRADMFRRKEALYPEYVVDQLRRLKERFGKPVILTVRSAREGGCMKISDDKRYEIYKSAIPLADAVDVEILSNQLLKKVVSLTRAARRKCVVIGSYHNFNKTPPNATLRKILLRARGLGCDIVKIATYGSKKDDLVRLAIFTIKNKDKKIVTISLGKSGVASRIFNILAGSLFTYGYLGQKPSAPGQISARELRGYLQDLGIRPKL